MGFSRHGGSGSSSSTAKQGTGGFFFVRPWETMGKQAAWAYSAHRNYMLETETLRTRTISLFQHRGFVYPRQKHSVTVLFRYLGLERIAPASVRLVKDTALMDRDT